MQRYNPDLLYDFNSIKVPPCSVFLYDSNGQVNPKKIFTITRKRLNEKENKVEVYILEFKKFIDYDPSIIVPVVHYYPN